MINKNITIRKIIKKLIVIIVLALMMVNSSLLMIISNAVEGIENNQDVKDKKVILNSKKSLQGYIFNIFI